MLRFDQAADLLDLEPGLYRVLRHPEKQIIVSIPIMRDNGEVEVFTGYRVLYNVGRDGGQEIAHLHAHIFGGRGLGRMVG